jgi:serine/threonine-protein kinase
VPEIGQLLGDRYRLLELHGEGGMATIYRAHDEKLDRDVAVKLLRPEFGRDEAFVARFRYEAQAAASLSHPNVVPVHDYGMSDAGPYIVMDLVEGQDLGHILHDRGFLPAPAAARIAMQIADGLAAAHAMGVVHRDVKPSNVLLNISGQVLLTDFGIARARSEAQLTLPGQTLGSVRYLSPEQARGESVTTASDIYSLGLVLFEMLTGRPAWQGDTAASVAMARLSGDAPAPSSVRADVPPAMDAIVRKALQRDPAMRFGSAAAFSDALGRFLSGLHSGAPSGLAAEGAAAGMLGAAAAGAAAGRAAASSAPRAAMDVTQAGTARRSAGVTSGPAQAVRRPAASGVGVIGGGRSGDVDDGFDDYDDGGPGRGPSIWTWAAAIVGVVLLVAVGAIVFIVLGGKGGTEASPSPSGALVNVPVVVGLTSDQARLTLEGVGLVMVVSGTVPDVTLVPGTVALQDPAANTPVVTGSTVNVSVATGPTTVIVPDLRFSTEVEAVTILVQMKLVAGVKTEAFDPAVPAGQIIKSSPSTGQSVAEGTPIDYVVSKGPEPTPSPSPSPSPSPPPTASPSPTAVPLLNVGEYRCGTLADATTAIEGDGFVVGTTTFGPGTPDDTWIVTHQNPAPGAKKKAGGAIDLTLEDPTTVPVCPP